MNKHILSTNICNILTNDLFFIQPTNIPSNPNRVFPYKASGHSFAKRARLLSSINRKYFLIVFLAGRNTDKSSMIHLVGLSINLMLKSTVLLSPKKLRLTLTLPFRLSIN